LGFKSLSKSEKNLEMLSVRGSNPPAATIKTNVSSLLADLEQLLSPQNLSSKD